MPQTRYVLRFISGKYQGGEFPLDRGAAELVIGRATDVDIVLVEDMVSRRHARILDSNGALTIEDLASTNGTFVNGEKVQRAELKEGDRILIGSSILKLVGAGGGDTLSAADARHALERTGARSATHGGRRMTGLIEEIPLPDLMQLLATSRKSGVLAVSGKHGHGRIHFRDGQIHFAALHEAEGQLPPRKVIYRMLGWTSGTFTLERPDERNVPEEISETVEALLMEGMRQLDELERLRARLPRGARLELPPPPAPALRALAPADLDLVQLVVSYGPPLAKVLDRAHGTDLEVATALLALVDRGYLIVKQ